MKTTSLLFCLLLVFAAAFARAAPPPWRMIYNSDLVNVIDCESPFNPRGGTSVLTEAKLRAHVAEAAVPGMGAFLLAPGFGWVPLWQSRICPPGEHAKWFAAHFQKQPANPVFDFVLNGGDIMGILIDEARKNKLAAIAAYRVNDGHYLDLAFEPEKVTARNVAYLSRFYTENPRLRRSPLNKNDWHDRVHDWSKPEPRAYKEALVCELIEMYPALDGVELDFQRHPHFFPGSLPMKKRVEIMVDFLKKIRAALDESSRKAGGAPRYLGVRVPLWPKLSDSSIRNGSWEETGFDPAAWAAAGVDWFNLASHYSLNQDMRGVALARKAAPGTRLYAELTHSPGGWRFAADNPKGSRGVSTSGIIHRNSTKELLETTARLACARGADGISFFNFAFYRAYGTNRDTRGPFNEPPFDLMPALAEPQALEDAPLYYFKSLGDAGFADGASRRNIDLDLKPARGNPAAILRLLVLAPKEVSLPFNEGAPPPGEVDRGEWSVKLNGKNLPAVQTPMPAYPFPTPYKAGLNRAEQYLAFEIPAGAIKDGMNKIHIETLHLPSRLHVRHLEIIQHPAKP